MPKICSVEGCEYTIWSRKSGKCKIHQDKPSQFVTPSKNNIKKSTKNWYKPKRKPVKKVSDKQKKRNAEYLKVRLEYLNEHKLCEVCGKSATDLHHVQGRVGDNLTDTSKFMAVCRNCHTKIETNREWAYEKGYLLKRL